MNVFKSWFMVIIFVIALILGIYSQVLQIDACKRITGYNAVQCLIITGGK